MNYKLITLCVVAAAVFAPLGVRAEDSDSNRSRPGAYVKDSLITTKVKAKLAANQPGSLAEIRVDTDSNGMVVLSGSTTSQASSDMAASITRGTEGVRSVRNNIIVRVGD